jgi:hypothetical protein
MRFVTKKKIFEVMPALRMYLEAAIGEAGVAFGEHAFHAHKK